MNRELHWFSSMESHVKVSLMHTENMPTVFFRQNQVTFLKNHIELNHCPFLARIWPRQI